MKTKIDNDKYGALAQDFLKLLKEHVLLYLDETLDDIEGVDVKDVDKELKKIWSEDFTFSIATVLDGSAGLICGDKVITPYLGFLIEGEKEIVIDDGKIALHELVGLCGDDGLEEGEEDEGIVEESENDNFDKYNDQFEVEIGFGSGVKISNWIPGNLGDDMELAQLTDAFYNVIDPAIWSIERKTDATISKIHQLFSEPLAIVIKEVISEKRFDLEVENFSNLKICELHTLIIERCKKFQDEGERKS